jgi:long-chain acyl-CoA synthetase
MNTGGYDDRPWLGLYGDMPADVDLDHPSALAMFRASVARAPETVALRYFDGALTLRELDQQTDALAAALLARGFQPGDRLAVYLQNCPQFVIGMVAAWKAGGMMVSVNPMNRARELTYLLTDSGASVLLCHDDLYEQVAREVVPGSAVHTVLTTSPLDYQARNDQRLFAGYAPIRVAGTEDLVEVIGAHRGQVPPPVEPTLDDIAFLTYTSGTTGVPKGAMNTHRNVVFTAQVYRDWCGVGGPAGDVVLGVAPLFHITGLIGHIAVSMLVPTTLVLAYRFHPDVMLDTIREHRPTFTIGAITAFIALLNTPGMSRADWTSFQRIYSGGAPIAPSVLAQFQDATGLYIHQAYGLTETTSPSHCGPPGVEAPVDPASGALSVGLPVFNTVVRIQDDDGKDLPTGEIGELVTAGPQVVAGYWNKPEETARSLPGGALHTGDVGFMDEQGWFYLVDRKKDMINAAGYKVWPREVEDVLYGHPAVREAAVVGVPDTYRGETVRAYVSLKPGASATPEELIAFCRERMAAYKYPRQLELVDELPKTVTGKILRRELRDKAAAEGG